MNSIANVKWLGLLLWLAVSTTSYGFYNPATGRWLSRDPIGETDHDNLYAFAANSAIDICDMQGMLTVSFNRYSYNKGDCGGMSIAWFLMLDKPSPLEGGYIIQQVDVYEAIVTCGEPLPTATPIKPVITFWEAFEIPNGFAGDQDTFRDSPKDGWGKKGTRTNVGEAKFFSKKVTKDLGSINKPPKSPYGGWGVNASGKSGGLPSTLTKPKWWDDPQIPPIDGPAFHRSWASWNCCCNPQVNDQDFEPKN